MPLIGDVGEHEVANAFGVARPLVGVAKRTTWLIDPDGTIRKIYLKVTPKGHAAEVLAATSPQPQSSRAAAEWGLPGLFRSSTLRRRRSRGGRSTPARRS